MEGWLRHDKSVVAVWRPETERHVTRVLIQFGTSDCCLQSVDFRDSVALATYSTNGGRGDCELAKVQLGRLVTVPVILSAQQAEEYRAKLNHLENEVEVLQQVANSKEIVETELNFANRLVVQLGDQLVAQCVRNEELKMQNAALAERILELKSES